MIQLWLEAAINDTFVQTLYNFEAAYSTKLIKQVSKKLKTSELVNSFVCPLMNLLAWVNPIIPVLDSEFIFHIACANIEILSCQAI